ncbi:MAG: hypothetical protein KatS3mg081_0958 [Gemmatimonadales bacterium]|nr:MAG: hypothetical protein KatS3mg081_0958 [Gemmatimonadales bacterium]
MKAQLTVLSGASSGAVFVFSKPEVAVGRHPSSDLQFHPTRELGVSARHAVIFKKGERWFIRDVGSRNGTLVNGHRITQDTPLDDTDQIKFGADGPLCEFRLVPDSTPDAAPRPLAQEEEIRTTVGGDKPARPTAAGRLSTTERVRIEVKKQTRRHRTLITVLLGALLLAIGAFIFESRRQERLRQMEVAALQARIDSVLSAADMAIASLQGQLTGLAEALRRSQSEVERLRAELQAAQQAGNTQRVASLRRQLDSAALTLSYQHAAAQVDYAELFEAHQDAVAIIYVEFAPGEVFTGTAFAVREDGVLITNRHVVRGADGTRTPRRIGIQFADSDQNFPARLLGVSPDADLAAVKVDIRGGVPTIGPLATEVPPTRPGEPVAIIGFPLGIELPMSRSGARFVARTTLTPGTVSKVLEDRIQIDGYGAEGASGSPVIDRQGRVVGVLFGGQPGTEGRIVFAVPAAFAARLLNSLN